MSETAERVRMDDPFATGMSFETPRQDREMVPVQGPNTDRAQAQVITAQRVAIKRNVPAILAEAKALATAAGGKFYYSIPFKRRDRDGSERTELVEGPAIGCAMAALNCYGNCSVEAFPAAETATHWTFMARFIDYEKGVTVTRSFNQRKSQNTGMRDSGRAEDLIFQIGQSKAIRNVILAGLKWLGDEMFTAAKSGLLQRIAKAPDKAREYLLKELAELEIEPRRVERVVGRTVPNWIATDMARVFAELQSIKDNFANADELYPEAAAEAEKLREEIEASKAAGTPSSDVVGEKPKPTPRAPKATPATTTEQKPAEDPPPANEEGLSGGGTNTGEPDGLEFS